MAMEATPSEIVDVLSHREDLVRCLLNRPKSKQELVEELDISRSTVDRATRELESLDLTECSENGYELTLYGRLTTESYSEFQERIAGVYRTWHPIESPPPIARTVAILKQRFELMECLLVDPLDKRDLVDELDVSRSTIDRGIRDLECLRLIERSAEGLVSTQCGRELLCEYEGLESELEDLLAARKLLVILDADAHIDSIILEDAEVILANDAVPHYPGTRMLDMLREATRSKGMSPTYTHTGVRDLFHN